MADEVVRNSEKVDASRRALAAKEDPAQLAFELEAYLLTGNERFVLNNDPAALRQRRPVRNRLATASA